jgi:hypothetical protein
VGLLPNDLALLANDPELKRFPTSTKAAALRRAAERNSDEFLADVH